MHKSSIKRMEWFAKEFEQELTGKNVLDIGSYNVNGCYREIFETKDINYTGLDMEEGPNVDIIPQSTYCWKEINDDEYTGVISGQAFEHIEFFWITMEEIVRVTKKDGLICIIAPNGFNEHRYPVDCWRFFTDGMVALARYFNLEIVHAHTNAAPSVKDTQWYSVDCADTMLVARKPYSGKAKKIELNGYACKPINQKDILSGFKTYQEHIESKDVNGNKTDCDIAAKEKKKNKNKPQRLKRLKKVVAGMLSRKKKGI